MRLKYVKDSRLGEKKAEIRRFMGSNRDGIGREQRSLYSNDISESVRKQPFYTKAKSLMFYLAFRSEVETAQMIKQAWIDGKTVSVPVVDVSGKTLKAAAVTSLETGMIRGKYGILEPDPVSRNFVPCEEIDIVFVPALAYDPSGYRIGYGKGYYDSWLKHFTIEKRVGLCFDFQVLDSLPKTENDLPVGTIITEKRVINVKPQQK